MPGEPTKKAQIIASILGVGISAMGILATASISLGAEETLVATAAIAVLLVLSISPIGFMLLRRQPRFTFAHDAAIEGRGYINTFRRAKRSLLLMHVDEDAPDDELLRLYRELLDRGVQIRRIVVTRDKNIGWRRAFGDHERLREREILEEGGELVRFSFAVVDDAHVLVALPGYASIDEESYSPDLLLRHLITLRGRDVGAAFATLHEQIWQRAKPVKPN